MEEKEIKENGWKGDERESSGMIISYFIHC